MNKTIAKKAGLFAAMLHVIGFIATFLYVESFHNPQAGLAWIFWFYIDMPVSLIYFAAGSPYRKLLEMLGDSFLAQLVYVPHFTHGLLGTLWWYFLPRLFLPRRLGGVWGRAVRRLEG